MKLKKGEGQTQPKMMEFEKESIHKRLKEVSRKVRISSIFTIIINS